MIGTKEDNVYKRGLVNKKTHFCHYYSVGNFSRVEIINLTGHFSTKMKNCISSAFKDHMNIFLNQKRSIDYALSNSVESAKSNMYGHES